MKIKPIGTHEVLTLRARIPGHHGAFALADFAPVPAEEAAQLLERLALAETAIWAAIRMLDAAPNIAGNAVIPAVAVVEWMTRNIGAISAAGQFKETA